MARGAFAVGNYLHSATVPITAEPMSFSVWMYALAGFNGSVFTLGDTAAANDYWLGYCTAGGAVRLYTKDGGVSAYAEKAGYSATTWHHLAFVTASSTSRIVYLDGTPGAENTTDLTPAGVDSFSLGVKKVNAISTPANAYFADAGLYDVALSQAQVTALANGAEPAMIQRANLQAAWYCTPGDAGETDILGSYDLTEVGAVPHQTHPPIRRAKIATPDRFGFAGARL